MFGTYDSGYDMGTAPITKEDTAPLAKEEHVR